MQISTRNADYIIDTLELRDKMQVLNEIFTDPAVVKVDVFNHIYILNCLIFIYFIGITWS